MSDKPAIVTVTGAAGNIGYALLFRLAAGGLLGRDRRLTLRLLEIPQGASAAEGVAMELMDCAFPRLAGVEVTDDPAQAFRDSEYAFLVGSRPRGPGMERSDLLKANAEIFRVQGKALNDNADRAVKVLVVGNPANTNALIARSHAPDLPARSFTAMTRLDHNRALALLAKKLNCRVSDIQRLCIWGNHSGTQYPDVSHATVDGTPVTARLDADWITKEYIPAVANRGAEIISMRKLSSAASAAHAAMEHMRDWISGSDGSWVSMGVPSDGSYDIAEGVVYSYPVICADGDYSIVPDLSISDESRQRMNATWTELKEERAAIASLL